MIEFGNRARQAAAVTALAWAFLLFGSWPGALSGQGRALAADFCGAGSNVPQPQNVILIILDDSSPSDLPFFNNPLVWPDQNNPPRSFPSSVLSEGRLRLPPLNRAMSRFYASRTCPGGLCELGTNFLHPTAPSELVVPVDLDGDQTVVSATNADAFRYIERDKPGNTCMDETGACDPHVDVLSGHGGLRQLVEEGLAFPRFYATSGKCAPTRSSMFTGRYPVQAGVSLNGMKLESTQVTVGDVLKALPGCTDGNPSTPCYATGELAKWHLGSRQGAGQAPWQRGFDDAIFFRGASRPPFKNSPLLCGPPAMPDNPPDGYRRGFFCTNETLAAAVPGCISSAECDAACPGGPGRCACAEGPNVLSSDDNFCYELDPEPCSADSQCRSGPGDLDSCVAWGFNAGPGNQVACHPYDSEMNLDCCLPRARTPTKGPLQNRYLFKKKLVDQDGTAGRFWLKDGERDLHTGEFRYPCNFDGNYHDSGLIGCIYDMRVFRDWATNFIGRHADEPFFLAVPLHSLHKTIDAPDRTLAHYSTAGLVTNEPGDAQGFWGSLEEIDAAIGTILDTLQNGVCNRYSRNEKAGLRCSTNSDCGGTPDAECVTDLAQRTMILVTSDQGQTNAPYGDPILKDGKGSTQEGGIRVGLLAWDPGIGVGSSDPGGRLRGEQFVASQVDLLPTVLDAAGCTPNYGTSQYEIKVCDGKRVRPATLCDTDQDCAASGGSCVSRLIAGRSMLAALQGTGSTTRDFAFASYPSEPQAIVARQGYYADGCSGNADCDGAGKVCAYHSNQPASAVDGTLDRHRLGGSCDVCTSDAECLGTMCTVEGSYCVSRSDQGHLQRCEAEPAGGSLDPIGDECNPDHMQRCGRVSDCSGNEVCVQIETPCNACSETSWKLLGGGGTGVGNILKSVAMYDLSSNPQEDSALDCLDEAQNPSNPDYAALNGSEEDLRKRLDGWFDCVTGGSSADCDTQKSPQ